MTDVEHILTTMAQGYRAKVRQDLALTVNLEIHDAPPHVQAFAARGTG